MSKLKLMIIVGTRPEIIRLSEVIKKCQKYFNTVLKYFWQFLITSDNLIISGRVPTIIISFNLDILVIPPHGMY